MSSQQQRIAEAGTYSNDQTNLADTRLLEYTFIGAIRDHGTVKYATDGHSGCAVELKVLNEGRVALERCLD